MINTANQQTRVQFSAETHRFLMASLFLYPRFIPYSGCYLQRSMSSMDIQCS